MKRMAGFSKSGQVALPFVLLVSGIIVEVAVAGAFIAYFLSASSLGERLSARAYSAAYAGVEDAMIRISRNKEFITSSPCVSSPCSYDLTVGSDSASLTITRSSDSASNTYLYVIASTGSAGNVSTRKKKLNASVIVDQTTGQMNLQSVNEIAAS